MTMLNCILRLKLKFKVIVFNLTHAEFIILSLFDINPEQLESVP